MPFTAIHEKSHLIQGFICKNFGSNLYNYCEIAYIYYTENKRYKIGKVDKLFRSNC